MEQEEPFQMEKWFQKKGLSVEASSSERLTLLWRLYIEKEHSVRVLTQEIKDLRSEHTAEIKTVKQYVEKIRRLSKTRDSVAQELEQENEMLKFKLAETSHQQEAQKKEIAQMLQQEGLAEVILCSLSEQVAYLLAERASLMDKLQGAETGKPRTLHAKCSQMVTSPNNEEQSHKIVNQASKTEKSKETERCLLERDLDEASTRLNMAHKEIRRLTDELESARLTQRAFEPELEMAHLEVEQLSQEVEKLKDCDVAELQKAKEKNQVLEAEVNHWKDSVYRMQTECLRLLEQESLLQQAQSQSKHLSEELKSTQDLLKTTRDELLSQSERNCQLQTSITFLEQENQRVNAEFQSLQQKLQEQDKSPVEQKQGEINSTRVQVTSIEEFKDLQQLPCWEESFRRPKSWLEQQVRNMVVELSTLKVQAEHSEFQRRLLAEKEKGLQQQVQSLLVSNTDLSRINTELSHQVQDLQSKDPDRLNQVIKNLNDQLLCHQLECKRLQTQLQQAQFDLLSQISIFNDKRERHKEKLGEAKEVYLRETGWRDEKIKEQERELRLLTKRIEQESNMVITVKAENEALLSNKINLLCQLSDAEEARNNATATVAAMQQKVDLLEKDIRQQQGLNIMKSVQVTERMRQLQDLQSSRSSEDCKNRHTSTKQASFSELGFETSDLLSIIQKTKAERIEELSFTASQNQRDGSELSYLNLSSADTHTPLYTQPEETSKIIKGKG